MNPIEELKGVIHKLHGATATHVESVPVKETFNGETVWEGIVEVFDLHGHPKANKALCMVARRTRRSRISPRRQKPRNKLCRNGCGAR